MGGSRHMHQSPRANQHCKTWVYEKCHFFTCTKINLKAAEMIIVHRAIVPFWTQVARSPRTDFKQWWCHFSPPSSSLHSPLMHCNQIGSAPCLPKPEYSLTHRAEHSRLLKGPLVTAASKLCLAMSGMSSYKLPNSLVFFRSRANKMSCEFLLLLLFLRSKNLECFTNAENMTVIDRERRAVRRYCAQEVLMSSIQQIW